MKMALVILQIQKSMQIVFCKWSCPVALHGICQWPLVESSVEITTAGPIVLMSSGIGYWQLGVNIPSFLLTEQLVKTRVL